MSDGSLDLGPIDPGEIQQWHPGAPWRNPRDSRFRQEHLSQFEHPALTSAALDELNQVVDERAHRLGDRTQIPVEAWMLHDLIAAARKGLAQ